MERGQKGLAVAVAALLAVVVLFGVSAATAPERGVTGENESLTLIGVQGGGPGLHEAGAVQMRDERGGTVWRIANADSYFDVTQLDNGSVMAGFMDSGYEECGPYESPCTHTGFRILDPDRSDPVVYEHSFPVRTKGNSEVHDVEWLDSGEFLLTDMEYERIFTIAPNGTTTWQWNASELYEAPPDPTRKDWLHINDVDVIGEGRYLVSVRNANQLVVIERGEGVQEIINEDRTDEDDGACTRPRQLADQNGDGDVRCGNPDLLDHQHNPQWLGEDAVLVADSDNDRIVELHREDDEWVVAWEIGEANGIDFRWPRDADRLRNGNTLITDSANARVLEVTRNGTVNWSATIDNNHMPYEAERLPEGETVGGRIYNPETGDVTTPGGDASGGVPVLTFALSIIQTSTNAPFWLTEWHLLAVLLAIPTSLGGVVVWWRDRGDELADEPAGD